MAIKIPEITYNYNSAPPKKLPCFLGANYDLPLSKCGAVGVSRCRLCDYYKFIGRSGGECQRLNSEVKGNWKGCAVGISMFSV